MKDLILQAQSLPLTHTSSYVIKYRSNKRIFYYKARDHACHGGLFFFNRYQEEPCSKILGYISKSKLNPIYPKAGRKYLKWVLCNSPWAYVYKTKMVKRALKEGVRFNVNVPKNLIAFGTVAYRHSYESRYNRGFPEQIKLWYDCVMKGADPLVMFTFLTCMGRNGEFIHINQGGDLHGPIHWKNLTKKNLRTFYLGGIPYKSPILFKDATVGTSQEVFMTLTGPNPGRIKDNQKAYNTLQALMPVKTTMGSWGELTEVRGIKKKDLPAFTHTFKEVICQGN